MLSLYLSILRERERERERAVSVSYTLGVEPSQSEGLLDGSIYTKRIGEIQTGNMKVVKQNSAETS